jgi:glycosyltransferase involved in cell wall biosynthesis
MGLQARLRRGAVGLLMWPVTKSRTLERLTWPMRHERFHRATIDEPSLSADLPARPRLLIDVTETAAAPHIPGIQRVVTEIVSSLYRRQHAIGIEVVPVRLGHIERANGKQYRPLLEARGFAGRAMGQELGRDLPAHIAPGDTLLLLDSTWMYADAFAKDVFPVVRRAGGKVACCVYDTIPVTHPKCFEGATEFYFERYLRIALEEADSIVAISRATLDEVDAYVTTASPAVRPHQERRFFHLGVTPRVQATAVTDRPEKTILMVGTLEPRKGHSTALDAFDTLWDQGAPINLRIIGHRGWLNEAMVRRITSHRLFGTRLSWSHRATDRELARAYASCDALLSASLVEGYGLPLIEAAQFGKPLIVSEIPVFREVCGPHAVYFKPADSADLARVLTEWLRGCLVPASGGPRVLSWDESGDMLLAALNVGRMVTHGAEARE